MHPQVRWVLNCQLLVTLLAALLAGVLQGMHAAASAALGGGIGFASSWVYVWRAMRVSGGRSMPAELNKNATGIDPKQAFRAQVAGEGYKFALTLLLFAAAFKGYAQIVALPMFIAYAATIVVYWVALLRRA